MAQKKFGRLAAMLFFIAAASFFMVAAIGSAKQRAVWMGTYMQWTHKRAWRNGIYPPADPWRKNQP